MKKRYKILLFITVLVFTFPISCDQTSRIDHIVAEINTELPDSPSGETTKARVIKVTDGDTIEVRISGDIYRVRYIGIDTPERGEQGYYEAIDANDELVSGRTVLLEKDISNTDRYGRLLRYVWVDDHMVNAILVATGYALSAKYPPDIYYADDFFLLEQYAERNVLGLWKYQGFGHVTQGR